MQRACRLVDGQRKRVRRNTTSGQSRGQFRDLWHPDASAAQPRAPALHYLARLTVGHHLAVAAENDGAIDERHQVVQPMLDDHQAVATVRAQPLQKLDHIGGTCGVELRRWLVEYEYFR